MSKKTLVLGASLKNSRYSNMAIYKLNKHQVPTVALGLRNGVVDGIHIDTGLPDYKHIHTVTLYLNAKRQEEYYDYILSLQPQRVIFNPGTENPVFYELLQKQHIEVEVACTLVLLGVNQY